MDFGKRRTPERKMQNLRMEEGGFLNTIKTTGVIGLTLTGTFAADTFKTKNILELDTKNTQSALLRAYRGGLGHYMGRYLTGLVFAKAYEGSFREMYTQSMNYPGFWRRLLAEITPLYLIFTINHILELKKQEAICRAFQRLPDQSHLTNVSWNKLKSIYSGTFTTITMSSPLAFFAIEKGLCEMARKTAYKKNARMTYQNYSDVRIFQRLALVPFASLLCYPIEVFKTCAVQTQIMNSPQSLVERKVIFRKTLDNLKNCTLKGLAIGFLPYTIGNLAIIASLEFLATDFNPLRN